MYNAITTKCCEITTKCGNYRTIYMNSFIKIFPNPTFVDVLLFFLLHPREEIYQAALVQATKGTLMQVQRALQRIEAARLITKIKRGNRAYYRANEKHPAFEDLKQAFMKTIV